MRNLSQTGLRWLWVTILVFILDRITKYLALSFLTPYEPTPVMPFFNLTLGYNTGAAFSFLAHHSGWQSWVFGILAVVISIGILIWLTRLSYRQRLLGISLSMIIGGALGNLCDRIYYGHVIDFIQWYVGNFYWPIFNIADSAVCIGAALLFLDMIRQRK